jgi:hypothetical protein
MEIDAELVKRLPEPEEGKVYRIESVEYVETPLQGLKGWRVTLRDVSTGTMHATMLWKRERVGSKSKLGCFIAVLGNQTDNWTGKTVRFVSWKPKDRKIQLAEETPQTVEQCVERLRRLLEHGKAYSVKDVLAMGIAFPTNIVEEAFGVLVKEGRAFEIPTSPRKWFFEG